MHPSRSSSNCSSRPTSSSDLSNVFIFCFFVFRFFVSLNPSRVRFLFSMSVQSLDGVLCRMCTSHKSLDFLLLFIIICWFFCLFSSSLTKLLRHVTFFHTTIVLRSGHIQTGIYHLGNWFDLGSELLLDPMKIETILVSY